MIQGYYSITVCITIAFLVCSHVFCHFINAKMEASSASDHLTYKVNTICETLFILSTVSGDHQAMLICKEVLPVSRKVVGLP